MRDKYVEEVWHRYFIWGESRDGLFVDVSDGDSHDVVSQVSREQAEYLIRERDAIVDALIEAIGEDYDLFCRLRKTRMDKKALE